VIDPSDIKANLAGVRSRIASAQALSPYGQDVTLVTITKTVGIDAVQALVRMGAGDVGENRASELVSKQDALAGVFEPSDEWAAPAQLGPGQVRWHFVGRLQTNKVKFVVGRVALIHSIDSERLMAAVDARARRLEIVQDVLVEVNLARDAAKAGLDEDAAESLLRGAETYPNVRVRGVMTMAPLGPPEGSRPVFAATRRLFDRLASGGYPYATIDTLSMGMTNDFEPAVQEGATCVRIGRAILAGRERR
jgi:PLP dependent protein